MVFAMQISYAALIRIVIRNQLPDPDSDADRYQNLSPWSLGHALPSEKFCQIRSHNFVSYPTDRQTDRQTDRSENITSFFGRGN